MKELIILSLFCMAGFSHASTKPNVIYIIADDLGYGDLSAYGQTRFSTPNIDAIAKKGILFKQHYSSAAVCAPARSSLMTGLQTRHGAVRGNYEVKPEGQQPMPAGTFTLAHMFKNAGYATGAFGKWGLGAPGSASEPLKMGFDRFYGFNCQRMAHHYYPYFLWNDNQREMLWGNFGLETRDYAPDLIQEQALRFVENNKDRPFFLYYAMIQPHAEMSAPDDGPHQEGGHDPDYFKSSGGLRGYKRDLYEGGIRVPMIACWPGKIPAGTVADHISAFHDVLPTMAQLTGQPTPRALMAFPFCRRCCSRAGNISMTISIGSSTK